MSEIKKVVKKLFWTHKHHFTGYIGWLAHLNGALNTEKGKTALIVKYKTINTHSKQEWYIY